MNHPKPEEWVPYVFGETTGPTKRDLRAHLCECSQCRDEVETWKRSLGRLDSWKLSRFSLSCDKVLPLLRFAAAAAIMLAVGISIGRATAPRVDPNRLLQAMAPEVQRQVREEISRTASQLVTSDRHYTDQLVQQVFVALKKDVDTLAVNTDVSLRNTAQQLVRLADYQEPANAAASNQ